MPSGRCPHCKRDTVFVTQNSLEPLSGSDVRQGLKRGTLVLDRCGHQDCRAGVYRELNPSDNEDQWDMYPSMDLEVDEELPDTVKRSLQEALDAFTTGIWNASAQACRRALQDALALKKPTGMKEDSWRGTGLKGKIKRLGTEDVLPGSLAEWAEDTRLGTILAVHGDEYDDYWATEEDATELLEFTKRVCGKVHQVGLSRRSIR